MPVSGFLSRTLPVLIVLQTLSVRQCQRPQVVIIGRTHFKRTLPWTLMEPELSHCLSQAEAAIPDMKTQASTLWVRRKAAPTCFSAMAGLRPLRCLAKVSYSLLQIER